MSGKRARFVKRVNALSAFHGMAIYPQPTLAIAWRRYQRKVAEAFAFAAAVPMFKQLQPWTGER